MITADKREEIQEDQRKADQKLLAELGDVDLDQLREELVRARQNEQAWKSRRNALERIVVNRHNSLAAMRKMSPAQIEKLLREEGKLISGNMAAKAVGIEASSEGEKGPQSA